MTTEVINIQIREDGSRVVSRNIDEIGKSADRASSPLDRLKGLIATVVTGAAITQLGRLADEYTNLQNRLRLVTTGTENLKRVTSELLGIANATRSDFTATGELYAKLANSTKELGLSQQELLNFTKQVNQAIVLSGASAQEAAGGLRQLAQGLASGTLRGDELNSIMENFPKVAQVIAEGMGHSIGEIRKLGAEGKISAEAIIDAFNKASLQLDQEFGTTVPTLSQSFTVMRNNFVAWVGDINESLGITAKLSELILGMANNLDIIIPLLVGVGTAIAAAFVPSLITAFTTQIKALWALMLANPFVALAAAVTAVVTSVYLLRDEIKLGIDETTTLGDLMKAIWEQVAPVIDSIAKIIGTFFEWMTGVSAEAYNKLNDHVDNYANENESAWLTVVRGVARTVDAIIGLFLGMFDAVKRIFNALADALTNNMENLGKAISSILEGDMDGALAAVKDNLAGWKEAGSQVGSALSDGLDTGFGAMMEGGFEARLNTAIERAKELGRERLNAAAKLGDLNEGGGADPKDVVDPDAAKKAAKELERLANALRQLKDQADPIGAAMRELAEAQEVFNAAVAKGLISQADAEQYMARLTEQYKAAIDPLGAMNEEIRAQQDLLRMSNEQARIEEELMMRTSQLKRDGVEITKEMTDALRAQLVVTEELARIAAARDQLSGQSGAEDLKTFQDQVTAMQQLLANGEFTQGDKGNALQQMMPWADLSATQEGMATYVQAHADMYEQIRILEEEALINHQTAEALRAQADMEYMDMRLQAAQGFFGSLVSLSSSKNKELANIGKAAAIAQTVINTYQSATSAYSAMAGIPYVGPFLGAAAAAAAVVAGMANVQAIRSQNVTGFRTGGSMVIGGHGGDDSQLVAFRGTPGERIQVNTPAQARALEQAAETNATRERRASVVNQNMTVVVQGRMDSKTPDQLARAARREAAKEYERS